MRSRSQDSPSGRNTTCRAPATTARRQTSTSSKSRPTSSTWGRGASPAIRSATSSPTTTSGAASHSRRPGGAPPASCGTAPAAAQIRSSCSISASSSVISSGPTGQGPLGGPSNGAADELPIPVPGMAFPRLANAMSDERRTQCSLRRVLWAPATLPLFGGREGSGNAIWGQSGGCGKPGHTEGWVTFRQIDVPGRLPSHEPSQEPSQEPISCLGSPAKRRAADRIRARIRARRPELSEAARTCTERRGPARTCVDPPEPARAPGRGPETGGPAGHRRHELRA